MIKESVKMRNSALAAVCSYAALAVAASTMIMMLPMPRAQAASGTIVNAKICDATNPLICGAVNAGINGSFGGCPGGRGDYLAEQPIEYRSWPGYAGKYASGLCDGWITLPGSDDQKKTRYRLTSWRQRRRRLSRRPDRRRSRYAGGNW